MKENGKIAEKIVKGLIIAGGTLIGMAVSAFVKAKDEDGDDVIDLAPADVTVADETVGTEEVKEG